MREDVENILILSLLIPSEENLRKSMSICCKHKRGKLDTHSISDMSKKRNKDGEVELLYAVHFMWVQNLIVYDNTSRLFCSSINRKLYKYKRRKVLEYFL